MVKIRLKRMGTTKRPVYRLVVADSRSPRDGRFIEAVGFYDPLPNPAVVRIDEEKVRTWMRKGARPSDSARQLLVQHGILAAQPRAQRATAADEPAAETPAKADGSGPAAATQPGRGADSSDVAAGDAGGEESQPASIGEPAGGDPTAAGPAAEPEAKPDDGSESKQAAEPAPAPETGAPAEAQVDAPADADDDAEAAQ